MKYCQYFSQGQFWSPGVVVACICLSVHPSVCPSVHVCGNHELVHNNSSPIQARITKFGFRGVKDLGLDPYCFMGLVTTFKVKFNFKSQDLPHLSLST